VSGNLTAEEEAILTNARAQIDGLPHISEGQRDIIKEQEVKAKTKIMLLLRYTDNQLGDFGINRADLVRMRNTAYEARDTHLQIQKLNRYLAAHGRDLHPVELEAADHTEIANKIDQQYPGIVDPARADRIALETRIRQIEKIPDLKAITGITRESLDQIANQSSSLQELNDHLEDRWVEKFRDNLTTKLGGDTEAHARLYYGQYLGPEGKATTDLRGAVSTAKSLDSAIVELQELEPTRKKIHNELIATINHRESKKLRVLNKVIELLGKYAETQGDRLALVRDILTKYSESYQTLLRGQSEASTAVLDGMLQLMQKILDALVQLQQSLRQTATQATGSMAISTF